MSFINYNTCASCHGFGSKALIEGLLHGHTQLNSHKPENLSLFLPNRNQEQSYRQQIKSTVQQLIEPLKLTWKTQKAQRWAVIVATTKGLVEDYVWQAQNFDSFDVYSPLLHDITELCPFPVSRSLVVSNACASSHGAIELAQRWLKRDWADHVLIVGVDLIGPFTLKGFATLKALSQTHPKPFDKNRDGLVLGDGIGLCVLSQNPMDSNIKVGPVASLCEGVSATRPDTSGTHLAQCFKRVMGEKKAHLFIAHGTGTFYNDMTESNALTKIYGKKSLPPVTCSKWSIGHSLGASGLMDLNLAIEIIKQKQIPGLKNFESTDLAVGDVIVSENQNFSGDKILISSLGFGGVCSALSVEEVI